MFPTHSFQGRAEAARPDPLQDLHVDTCASSLGAGASSSSTSPASPEGKTPSPGQSGGYGPYKRESLRPLSGRRVSRADPPQFRAHLWKKSPGMSLFGVAKYQWRYVLLSDATMYWWANEAAAEQEDPKGLVDFTENEVSVHPDEQDEWKFTLMPCTGQWNKRASFTGAQDGRTFQFDVRDSHFSRSDWFEAIRIHNAYGEAKRHKRRAEGRLCSLLTRDCDLEKLVRGIQDAIAANVDQDTLDLAAKRLSTKTFASSAGEPASPSRSEQDTLHSAGATKSNPFSENSDFSRPGRGMRRMRSMPAIGIHVKDGARLAMEEAVQAMWRRPSTSNEEEEGEAMQTENSHAEVDSPSSRAQNAVQGMWRRLSRPFESLQVEEASQKERAVSASASEEGGRGRRASRTEEEYSRLAQSLAGRAAERRALHAEQVLQAQKAEAARQFGAACAAEFDRQEEAAWAEKAAQAAQAAKAAQDAAELDRQEEAARVLLQWEKAAQASQAAYEEQTIRLQEAAQAAQADEAEAHAEEAACSEESEHWEDDAQAADAEENIRVLEAAQITQAEEAAMQAEEVARWDEAVQLEEVAQAVYAEEDLRVFEAAQLARAEVAARAEEVARAEESAQLAEAARVSHDQDNIRLMEDAMANDEEAARADEVTRQAEATRAEEAAQAAHAEDTIRAQHAAQLVQSDEAARRAEFELAQLAQAEEAEEAAASAEEVARAEEAVQLAGAARLVCAEEAIRLSAEEVTRQAEATRAEEAAQAAKAEDFIRAQQAAQLKRIAQAEKAAKRAELAAREEEAALMEEFAQLDEAAQAARAEEAVRMLEATQLAQAEQTARANEAAPAANAEEAVRAQEAAQDAQGKLSPKREHFESCDEEEPTRKEQSPPVLEARQVEYTTSISHAPWLKKTPPRKISENAEPVGESPASLPRRSLPARRLPSDGPPVSAWTEMQAKLARRRSQMSEASK